MRAARRACARIISFLAGRRGEQRQRLMETVGPRRSHRELRPPRTWRWLPKLPASSLLASAPEGAWSPFAQLPPPSSSQACS